MTDSGSTEEPFVTVLTDDVTPASHRAGLASADLFANDSVDKLGARRFFQGVLVGALVAALIASSVAIAFERRLEPENQTLDVQGVLDEIEPAVVRISVEVEGSQDLGAGTGFVISADGAIVTNAHVVADADAIRVTLSDERTVTGTLLGIRPAISRSSRSTLARPCRWLALGRAPTARWATPCWPSATRSVWLVGQR